MELAGSVPDVVNVTIKTRAADRVASWRGILSDSSVDDDGDDGIYVRGAAPAGVIASILSAAAHDAVELCWDVDFWQSADGSAMTPAADNFIYLRINAREDLRFDEPGCVDLGITVNSHSSDPDVEDAAEIVAVHAGLSLG
jgi:hypothetical protein